MVDFAALLLKLSGSLLLSPFVTWWHVIPSLSFCEYRTTGLGRVKAPYLITAIKGIIASWDFLEN